MSKEDRFLLLIAPIESIGLILFGQCPLLYFQSMAHIMNLRGLDGTNKRSFPMKIYDSLKKDHEKLKLLLQDLVTENQRIDVYKNLLTQIRDELVPHARAEEAVLYNSIRDMNTGKEIVAHSYKEHMEAETLLRTLQALKIFD